MPQPAELDRLLQPILDIYQAAQASIEEQLQGIVDEAAQARRVRRLRELQRSIDAEMRMLRAATADWLSGEFPRVYELGGVQGAGQVGGEFAWSQANVDAVQRMAADTFDQVLSATEFVSAEAKSWVREAARRQTALSLTEGRTAVQAGRALAKDLAAGRLADALGGPVGMVRYGDGSLRRLDDYAEMLMRTRTAVAFNQGSLDQFSQFGVGWVEVLDGQGCGWTSHDDGDTADGTVRTVQAAGQHPLSHPNCRRSFIGRPDIETAERARDARPSTTAAQRADQAQAEADRAAQVERRREARAARDVRSSSSAGRVPRGARSARAGRGPRGG